MKNVCVIMSFVFLALGCSYDDITTPLKTNAPPVNHAKLNKSPNARQGCNQLWCAIRGSYETLYGQYPRIQAGASVTWSWYVAQNSGNFGYFPLSSYPNLRMRIFGPSSANYPLLKTVNVTNNSNLSNGAYVGYGECGIPTNTPNGWYILEVDGDNTYGGCAYAAIDFQVVPY